MKQLTMGQMASARLKANRKAYLSLLIGIFLSVFLVTTLILCVQGIILAMIQRNNDTLGYENAILLDTPEFSDQMLADTGYFDTIGHVYVPAHIENSGIALGYYDETGSALMNRHLVEGRLPESPGEIAMERSAMLAVNEGDPWILGDSITLNLSPIDGIRETRSFQLVGILTEQSANLKTDNIYSKTFESAFPALLVSASEPGFSTGRIAVHRVMTLLKPVTPELFRSFEERIEYSFGRFLYRTVTGRFLESYEPYAVLERDGDQFVLAIMASLLFLSLLVSCGVGIAGSMESLLSQRREEIGILRAVGATKRQIRRIFGRENWILALGCAPFAIVFSCLFIWGLGKWMPESMVFRFNILLLLPVSVLSAAVILISGSIPLHSASNQPPMGVIRDTGMLRKAKKIRSQKEFHVPTLLSQRLLRLHPGRLTGAVLLSGLMCFSAAVFAIALYNGPRLITPETPAYGIAMLGNGGTAGLVSFLPGQPLSEESIRQLERLPNVSRVEISRQLDINVLLEKQSQYLGRKFTGMNNVFLSLEDYAKSVHFLNGDTVDADTMKLWYEENQENYQNTRHVLGIDKEIAGTDILTLKLDEETIAQLEQCLSNGAINKDAIDAGQEVLILAPKLWYVLRDSRNGGYYTDVPNKSTVLAAENDWAFAGHPLSLLQLYTDNTELMTHLTEDIYRQCERRTAEVTVGGVLDSHPKCIGTAGWGDILTTEEGLRNMGLFCNGWDFISIYLNRIPDAQTEELLTEQINAIARRAEGAVVFNDLQSARDDNTQLAQLRLLTGCITLVLFSVSAGMVISSITRQLQADGKRIGMLRAVGADERTIFRCYAGQAYLSLAIGMLLAVLALILLKLTDVIDMPASYYPSGITAILFFTGSCILLCHFALLRSVRRITQQSIIENIREL